MDYRRYVVAACSRSGTTYIADLLTRAGLTCTHEGVFLVSGGRVPWQEQLGDAAFGAAKYADRLGADTLLLHQVRHPLKVFRSWVAHLSNCWDTFHRTYEGLEYPSLRTCETPLHLAMRYWVLHNRRIEAGPVVRRYRVEDVGEDLVLWLSERVGQVVSRQQAREAVAATARDTNTMRTKFSQEPMREIAWDDLPPGPDRDDVLELAYRYGYLGHANRDRF